MSCFPQVHEQALSGSLATTQSWAGWICCSQPCVAPPRESGDPLPCPRRSAHRRRPSLTKAAGVASIFVGVPPCERRVGAARLCANCPRPVAHKGNCAPRALLRTLTFLLCGSDGFCTGHRRQPPPPSSSLPSRCTSLVLFSFALNILSESARPYLCRRAAAARSVSYVCMIIWVISMLWQSSRSSIYLGQVRLYRLYS